jgi:hypothetical protein
MPIQRVRVFWVIAALYQAEACSIAVLPRPLHPPVRFLWAL